MTIEKREARDFKRRQALEKQGLRMRGDRRKGEICSK